MEEIQEGRMLTALAPAHGEHSARLGLTARLTSSGQVPTSTSGETTTTPRSSSLRASLCNTRICRR
jgi:hypothetical protein